MIFPYFFVQPKKQGGKKGRPGEGFLISLTSNGQEETSAIAAVSSLSFSVKEIAENASRAIKWRIGRGKPKIN